MANDTLGSQFRLPKDLLNTNMTSKTTSIIARLCKKHGTKRLQFVLSSDQEKSFGSRIIL
jgi:hypothetical protein